MQDRAHEALRVPAWVPCLQRCALSITREGEYMSCCDAPTHGTLLPMEEPQEGTPRASGAPVCRDAPLKSLGIPSTAGFPRTAHKDICLQLASLYFTLPSMLFFPFFLWPHPPAHPRDSKGRHRMESTQKHDDLSSPGQLKSLQFCRQRFHHTVFSPLFSSSIPVKWVTAWQVTSHNSELYRRAAEHTGCR